MLEVILELDKIINQSIIGLQSPLLTKIMLFIHHFFMPEFVIFFLILLTIVLVYKNKVHQVMVLFFSVSAAGIIGVLLDTFVPRARPENALIFLKDNSFPSGHTLFATLLFFLLIYSFKKDIKNKINKAGFILLGIIGIVLVGFDRIYLNVHWFSDVLAGFLLGVFLIMSSIILLNKRFGRKKLINILENRIRQI